MAGEVTTTVEGLDDLQKKLEQLPAKLAAKGIRQALRAGGMWIQKLMEALAPRHIPGTAAAPSGFLAKHFNTRIRMIGGGLLGGDAFVGPQGRIDYPDIAGQWHLKIAKKTGKAKKVGRISILSVVRFLEFGTSKMGKKPFMTQAFESGKSDAFAAMQAEIYTAIDDIDRGG